MHVDRALMAVSLSLFLLLAGCGSDGGAPPGGSGGTLGITCDELSDFVEGCFDDYCAGQGSSSRFCSCWTNGRQDINVQTCSCIPYDPAAACAGHDLSQVDPTLLSCTPAYQALAGICPQ